MVGSFSLLSSRASSFSRTSPCINTGKRVYLSVVSKSASGTEKVYIIKVLSQVYSIEYICTYRGAFKVSLKRLSELSQRHPKTKPGP